MLLLVISCTLETQVLLLSPSNQQFAIHSLMHTVFTVFEQHIQYKYVCVEG